MRPRCTEYVAVQLAQNWVYNDGAYVSLAFDAAAGNNLTALIELDKKSVPPKHHR